MSDILIERRGRVGLVTFNRPHALNTLSLSMYRQFEPALIAWQSDPDVAAVLVRGAGERAFCAGGDVVAVYQARAAAAAASGRGDYKADFFREEYRLMRRIHRMRKPCVALMDGITMGGGVGVAVNSQVAVATERTLFAMPEVHLGLFPDVGATRFLNRAPGRVGLYLALTGRRIGGADARALGFATQFVPHERVAALTEALVSAKIGATDEPLHDVERVLAELAGEAGEATLPPLLPAIDRAFSGDSVEAIVANLEREEGAWAAEALDAMARASPLSLKLTFHQLRIGRAMEIEAALALEYRMTQHVMRGHDFYEGVRAILVDKDRNPRWQHRSLAEVSEDEVALYFEPIEHELVFE